MPLFTRELNEVANYIGRANLTFWLHTAVPTNAQPANGRTTVGGGAYEAGVVLAASDISNAMNGDIDSDVVIDFGTADEAVGTVIRLSAYRGANAVAHWPIPATIMGNGDSFQINANSLVLNGSTT